ncbi:TonB-dependent receptor domain-containing protein [Bradyrhizobium sp. WD16]|uniref:TonB-dependent receptor family protein n=1 Tax=Bradyrhizobium sp. WD16 TaxID=1521768 RepID=UPI0020A4C964|nr:TonB-dependent receptor [Bradyrhizobium sp. WD16]UTD29526.1 TonB-dependent receptor [Bradyrhizobium sp. WD16]
MLFGFSKPRALLLASAAVFISDSSSFAQSSNSPLPGITIDEPARSQRPKRRASLRRSDQTTTVRRNIASQGDLAPAAAPATASGTKALTGNPAERSGSLTVPTAAEAQAEINRTPGAVTLVPSSVYATSTPAATIKDIVDYVPGVLLRMNEPDQVGRLSIRGSGLSRNADVRGVAVYMDGIIPLTRATGDTSFDEIDPTAYRYTEVYKGANALRFGAATLGGALNFVTPTGYDASRLTGRVDIGSFGFKKWNGSSGGVYGPADYFVNVTRQQDTGFRQHTEGENFIGSTNFGYRFTPDIETRFYFNSANVSRNLAGNVSKSQALTNPAAANIVPGPNNDNIDWNIGKETDAKQVANKTAIRFGSTTLLEFGGFYLNRDINARVFAVIDTQAHEAGGFLRLVDDRLLGGFRNRLVAGASLQDGTQRRRQFINNGGNPGKMNFDADQIAKNRILYAENSFYVVPNVALVAGVQYAKASREQRDYLGSLSGIAEYDLTSPKAGVLWEVTPQVQLFGNVSRSAEAPTFGEVTITSTSTVGLKPQKATTYEIGTRGDFADVKWEAAIYRSLIQNEFQCLTSVAGTGFCTQINIDRSVHQGVELGTSAALYKGLLATGSRPDEIWLNAAYTYGDFRFDNDPAVGNNQLPGQPRHYMRAQLLYKHPSGVYFGPNVEWVPERYFVDSANTAYADPYTLWGAKFGFDDGGPVTAYIEGRNLANTAYISSVGVANQATDLSKLFYPGSGRAVYAGLQVKW